MRSQCRVSNTNKEPKRKQALKKKDGINDSIQPPLLVLCGWQYRVSSTNKEQYTARQIKNDMLKHHPAVLPYFKVDTKDRKYQFRERNALSIELRTEKVLLQKLNYIHNNPVKAGICSFAEEYTYSTAPFYTTGVDDLGFVTYFRE